MDNDNSTTAYSIANMDEFKLEVISMLRKIKERIDGSASKRNAYQNNPSNEVAVTLAVLKAHEFKLSEMLKTLEILKREDWEDQKESIIEDFDETYKAFSPTVKG